MPGAFRVQTRSRSGYSAGRRSITAVSPIRSRTTSSRRPTPIQRLQRIAKLGSAAGSCEEQRITPQNARPMPGQRFPQAMCREKSTNGRVNVGVQEEVALLRLACKGLTHTGRGFPIACINRLASAAALRWARQIGRAIRGIRLSVANASMERSNGSFV